MKPITLKNYPKKMIIKLLIVALGCIILSACSKNLESPSSLLEKKSSSHAKFNEKNNKKVDQIEVKGKQIKLSDRVLYVDERIAEKQRGKFVFSTLQDAIAFAEDGTEHEPTVVYLSPNVYWVDDRDSPNTDNNLVGLRIHQQYIKLVGLGEKREHVVIAGNRGQMAGALGNWTTLGVGNGFHAENITFGNYCNIDLVYELDPTKNVAKRQENITQAQVITHANQQPMDKWVFDNTQLISYLNLLASSHPERVYIKNSYLQATDDALALGKSVVFENCDIKLFANHPTWSPASNLQAFLGCRFEIALPDPEANSVMYLSKEKGSFALLDNTFSGNATKIEWENVPKDDLRSYVYQNTLNGKAVVISPEKPKLSIHLTGQLLHGFKVGNSYNIYNLLRGDDDWDPAHQKQLMADYADIVYRINLSSTHQQIQSQREQAIIRAAILPNRMSQTPISWSVDNPALRIINQDNNQLVVTGFNNTEIAQRVKVTAKNKEGNVGVIYITVLPELLAPPVITDVAMLPVTENTIHVTYKLDDNNREDHSLIDWYRATTKEGSDKALVAVTRLNQPLKSYVLTKGDIGFYLMAEIKPKHNASTIGGAITLVTANKILAKDVNENLELDFKSLPTEIQPLLKEGFWTVDSYRPSTIAKDVIWSAEKNPWTYGEGSDATLGRTGLMTTGRGARLLYTQSGNYDAMSINLRLSPHKVAGQGFGSATNQYMDIYIKYNTHTQTGYGLRIERTPAFGNGVRFTLYEFNQGIGKPLNQDFIDASVFVLDSIVELTYKNNVLTAQVTTLRQQQAGQAASGLAHKVKLKAKVAGNTFGGFGIQHTGTTSAGNRVMLESITVKY